jgi:hypothetical protein
MILPPVIGVLEGSICELSGDQFAWKQGLLSVLRLFWPRNAPCDSNRGELQFAVSVWRMSAKRREPDICGTGQCVGP